MKSENLFSGKNKNNFKMSFAEFFYPSCLTLKLAFSMLYAKSVHDKGFKINALHVG